MCSHNIIGSVFALNIFNELDGFVCVYPCVCVCVYPCACVCVSIAMFVCYTSWVRGYWRITCARIILSVQCLPISSPLFRMFMCMYVYLCVCICLAIVKYLSNDSMVGGNCCKTCTCILILVQFLPQLLLLFLIIFLFSFVCVTVCVSVCS